jgi:hypothetical protein
MIEDTACLWAGGDIAHHWQQCVAEQKYLSLGQETKKGRSGGAGVPQFPLRASFQLPEDLSINPIS